MTLGAGIAIAAIWVCATYAGFNSRANKLTWLAAYICAIVGTYFAAGVR